MKHVLTLSLFLLSLSGFAQRPLPVSGTLTVGNPQTAVQLSGGVRSYESVRTLAQNEGIEFTSIVGPVSVTVTGTVAAATVNTAANTTTIQYTTNVTLNSSTLPLGSAFVPHTLEWMVSKQHEASYYTPYATVGAYVGYLSALMPLTGAANERVTRMMGAPIHSRQRPINATISQITDVVSGTVSPTIGSTAAVAFTYRYNVIGWLMTDDLNLSATQYVDIWGDSIWYGTGPTTTETQLAFLLREYWTDKGYNYRLRNWAVPGTTTANHIGYMQNGRYYHETPKTLLIAIGTNDVNTGVSNATLTANKLILINKALALYPGVKIIVTAISPRLDTSKEALAVSARAAEKAAITAHPKYNSQVFYVESIGTAWTATDATKYLASDGANGVHPTDAAVTGFYFPALKAFLDANPALFN